MSTTIDAPRARPARKTRFNIIWLIPVITVLIGGYIAWDTYSKRGPTITITFISGEGLTAGQSHIKHKDVDLGLITSVALSPDASHVTVTADMKHEAIPFLTDQTRFWVVTPRLFAGQISGLDTLISGAYVELLPADTPGGKSATAFTGLENPPVLTSNVPGTTFLLDADRVGAVNVGSPVFYRDMEVGTVLGWDLQDMAKRVTIHAFVRAPFDAYVHDGSRFWNVSGIGIQLGSQGVQVQLESFKALLLGGVAFTTSEDALKTSVAAADRSFKLFADRQAAEDASFTTRIPVIGYFQGSVAGLGVGSPVTFRGLRIGRVTDIGLEYDPSTDKMRTVVHYEIEPERFADINRFRGERTPLENARFLVEHGLRAELESTNMLLGQLQVALDFFPDAPPAQITMEGKILVLPTMEGGLGGLERSVNSLLTKVNNIPFQQIGDNLNQLLVSANAVTGGPETKRALVALQQTLADTNEFMKRLDAGTEPVLRRLPAMADDLQAAVANTNKLVVSANTGYGENSKFYRDLDRLVLQLDDAVQSIRVLADLLSRHPEALVRGRTNTGAE